MPVLPVATLPGDIVRLDANGSVNPTGSFALSGTLTPATIGANQNDYNPSGLSAATMLRLSASTPGFNITGLAGGVRGRVIVIHNVGAFPLVLKDEDAGSSAANRFALTTDMTLSPDSVAILQYDLDSLRWRASSGGGGGGGLTSLPTGNTIWVDKINGNDGTGLRGREDKPFLTIQAAINAVTTNGDLVIVGPGSYPEKLTLTGFNAHLIGRPLSATLNTPNVDPGVKVNPALVDTESVITTGGAPWVVVGIWFIGEMVNTLTGTIKCLKATLSTDFYACKFDVGVTSGVSSNVNAITVSYEAASGQSTFNNCFIGGPSGPLSGGTGEHPAVKLTSLGRARFINCRTFPTTIANRGDVVIDSVNARGYFWGCEIDGHFTITNAADWWLGIDSTVSGILTVVGTPSIEGVAGVTVLPRLLAGRKMATQYGPTGVRYTLQPGIFANKIGWWSALGNSTTTAQVSFGNTVTGTATAHNVVSTTSLSESMRFIQYVSAATAGSSAGTRHALAQFFRGGAAGRGGFFYCARFIVETPQTDMRWFVGMRNATGAPANANPSAMVDMIGFGIDSTQTTVRFFHNDGAGTATAIDLGASFPATTGDPYEIRLFSAPNGTTIFYSIENLNTGVIAEGSVTTNIPAGTTLLSPLIWINNGATAAAVSIGVVSQYIETDN